MRLPLLSNTAGTCRLSHRLAALLVLLWILVPAVPLWAASMSFGTRTLQVPAPKGFVAVGREVPDYFAFAQGYLPAINRLVEIYHAPEHATVLRAGRSVGRTRYFQVQTLRETEGVAITPEEFSAGMGQMEASLEQTLANIDTKALTDAGNEAATARRGERVDVSIDGTRYLGVSRRAPWGLFFSLSSSVAVADSKQAGRVVCAGAAVLIDRQLLYLYAYAADDTPADRRWAEAAVSAWADAIRAANPNRGE